MQAAVPLGLSVVGGAMSMASGMAGKSAMQNQAAMYQQQARLAALEAQSDEANRLTQLNKEIGSSRAMEAAGNIDVYGSPSAQAFEDANRDVISRTIAYDQTSSIVTQQRDLAQASADQQAGNWSVIGGFMQAASGIYGGVDKYMQVSNQGGAGGGMMPGTNLPSGGPW